INSPSMVGDNASAHISVPARSVPAHPGVSKVILHYDNHRWLMDFKPSDQIILRFNRNGEFDGVYLTFGVAGKEKLAE
ncbi:hypothetical protein ACYTX7_10325, partial [Streptococcus pyogenes]